MERIQLRKQLIKCCVFAISQLVIVSGTFILKSEKAEAAGNNLAISIANDYVNIRNKPSLNGKVKGRLYRGSAVYITRTYKNGWALIKSGNFRGYIKKEFLATGTKARQLARIWSQIHNRKKECRCTKCAGKDQQKSQNNYFYRFGRKFLCKKIMWEKLGSHIC